VQCPHASVRSLSRVARLQVKSASTMEGTGWTGRAVWEWQHLDPVADASRSCLWRAY
jgi:hypothetical protein